MPADTETPPAPALTKTFIPQDLHDREYLKPFLEKPWNAETGAEVFKKLEGAQVLLGKKTVGIPEGDDPKLWEEFHGKLRPAKADDYEIEVGENPDKEWLAALRTGAHESGLSKLQLKGLTSKIMPFLKGRAEKHAAEMAKMEKEYTEFTKAAMGEGWEKKQGRVMAAIKELAPEGAKQFIDKLNNNDMALMVATIDAVLGKYAKEDDFKSTGGGGGGAPDKEALVAELHKLYAEPGWKDFTKPNSAQVRKRVDEILSNPLMKQ